MKQKRGNIVEYRRRLSRAAALCAAVLFGTMLSGCSAYSNTQGTSENNGQSIIAPAIPPPSTAEPLQEVAPATPIAATPAPEVPELPSDFETGSGLDLTGDPAETSRRFQALDLDVFRAYAMGNGYTLHCLLKTPQNYGISAAPSELYRWPGLSDTDRAEAAAAYETFRSVLASINRDQLSETEQLAYDVTEQYLASAAERNELYLFEEPLLPSTGVHAQIPLNLAFFRLETPEDAEAYLSLMEDLPRYFSEILALEQKRAEAGLFMTESALKEVLTECEPFCNPKKDLYLYDSFETAVSSMKQLKRSERKALEKRHGKAIRESMAQAYTMLSEGLRALSAHCRKSEGMQALGDQAKSYYALRLCEEASDQITPEEALELLETAMQDMFLTMQTIYAETPEAANGREKLTFGSAEKDMAYLEKLLPGLLTDAPDGSITLQQIPKSLREQMPAAACVVPPIDGGETQTILVNDDKQGSSRLLTLAHEAYPGHLCQFAIAHGLPDVSLMQRTLPFSGYSEGWAQMAEEWMLLEQTKFDRNTAMFVFSNSMLSNAILPSILSIYVNYHGYTKEEVRTYLEQYGLSQDAYVDLYYALAVDSPFQTLRYGIGYAELSAMMQRMSETQGEMFDQRETLDYYLKLGPAYYSLLFERMDEWADAKVLE